MRPTTKRRLSILLLISLVVIGGVGGFTLFRMSVISADEQKSRADGLAAFNKGQYDEALNKFSAYMKDDKNKVDADVVYAMAVSRSMVPLPNNAHLKTSMDWFNNFLSLRKGDPQGQHKLLELYTRVGWNPETLALSEEILQATPTDLPALRAKANALSSQRNYDAALAVSQKINEIAPLDLESQRLTYYLLGQLKRPAAELLARAKADVDAHPQDPRFELLQASAYNYAGDQANAEKLLRISIARKAPDADFVRLATKLLDNSGQYDMSQDLLARAASDLNDPDVLQMLVERLWQNGQTEEMAKRLETVKADDPKADTNLLAMKAISLLEHNRSAEALSVVKVLASRTLDDEAFAWSSAIPARYAVPAPDPKSAIATLTAAAARDRDNAVVRLWLGEAYMKLGETELAINAWRSATNNAPSWAEPYVRQATVMSLHGRGREAVEQAALAAQRAPKSLQTRIASAMALSSLSSDDPKSVPTPQLLQIVQQVQTESPNEPQTLPMYVAMLAQLDQRPQAILAIKNALAAKPAVPADTLLRVAAISVQLKLEQEDTIYNAMAQAGDKSPELALARAKGLLAQGKADEGLQRMRASATPTDPAAWQVATAQYLDAAKNPAADAAWKTVVEQFPSDFRAQSAYLKSDTRTLNRPVWSASIDRLKALTVDEGVAYRMERAKFQLTGTASEKDRADAVTTLNDLIRSNPDLVEPRLLLATTFLQANNTTGAIEQLKTAAQLRPSDPEIALTLGSLLVDSGKVVEGQAFLDRVATSGQLSSTGTLVVAQAMADQGQLDRAVQILAAPHDADPTRDALLAQFYVRLGKADDARRIFDKLAVIKPVTTGAVIKTADYYFSRGQSGPAQAVLARLSEASDAPTPADANLIRAQLAEQYQSAEIASGLYQDAVKTASSPKTLRALAGFQLRQGQFAEARATVAQALALAKNNTDLAALAKLTDTLAALPAGLDVRIEVATLSHDPQNAAMNDLLTAAAQSAAAKEAAWQRAARFKEISDKYPKSWTADQRMIQAYIDAGQLDKARNACLLAANAFPTEPAPLQMLCSVYSAQNDWNAELATVQQWRLRSRDNLKPCDVAAADAMVGLGQYRQAIITLQPYVDAAKKNVVGSMDVIWLYCRSLLRDGRTADAAVILEPEIKQASVRRLWLYMAGDAGPNLAAGSGWIDKVSPQLDPNLPADQSAIGRAWFAVAERYHDQESYVKAAKLLEAYANRFDGDSNTWALIGESRRNAGDLTGAETAYRQALIRGDTTYAPNAMAFMLLMQDRSLDEALALANKAVESGPRVAGYYDTRGQIYLRLQKYDLAIKDFDQAVVLQPDLIDSMVGKATALNESGKKDKAAEMLRFIDTVMIRQPDLSPVARKQLAGLKSASLN